MRDLRSSITFITSSLGTKWESYSQALLLANFPECERIVVDGTRHWDPLFFVGVAQRVTTDYIVLVDEDCFVFHRGQLVALLDSLEQDAETALIATPDGGTFHRDYNPVACNPFFTIVKRRALLAATAFAGWKSLTWRDVENTAIADHVAQLDGARMNYGFDEPYYPFFWAVLRAGFKIRYLVPELNPELLASELRCGPDAAPMLVHMWWLRSWDVESPEPYLRVSNRSRYDLLERTLLLPRFRGTRQRAILIRENALRHWRNIPRAMHRLAGRMVGKLQALSRSADRRGEKGGQP